MKKRISGGKKDAQEPVAVRDPESGELVVSAEEIKKVTLKYCEANLRKETFEGREEKIKEEVHKARMEEEIDEECEFSKEEFEEVLRKFVSKQTSAYDLLLKASDKYKEAIFKLCQSFIRKEEFPRRLHQTILHMIWKKKGRQEEMRNNRFIHMKDYLARTCEALVVGKMKQTMFNMSTMFQIGGQSGHSVEEHLFSVKSLMGLREEQGEGCLLTLVDIVSFFDREDIRDVLDAMEEMGVNRKVARVWYRLNEKTEIKVKTAVGMTEAAEVGALVGQGSTGAAVASQAMVDMGLKQYFASSSDESYYGSVRFESAAFQDDILKPSDDVLTGQAGMTRLAAMLGERKLEAHREKTGYLVCGTEEFKEKMAKELERRPLTFGDFEVKRKVCEKYLGQMIHQDGLARSVGATIEERLGKVKGAIYTVASLLETYELQAVGGMMAAKYLWEGAIVPSLLAGAGTWVAITGKQEEMLEEVQELYWRTILQVPKGTPKVMLRAETASMRMKQRVWKQKLMLAARISGQEGSLASQIYAEQLEMGWPGLAKEVKEISEACGVEDMNKRMMNKEEIHEAVFYASYKETKEEMKRYEKLKEIKDEDFRKEQDYMEEKAMDTARMAFRIRTKMVKNVKMNFKNMYKDNLKCEKCEMDEDESQEHLLECPGWREERGDLEVTTTKGKVMFFTRIMKKKK